MVVLISLQKTKKKKNKKSFTEINEKSLETIGPTAVSAVVLLNGPIYAVCFALN